MKVRDLIQHLRQGGAVPARTKGSHGVWKFPGGGTLSIVVNHMNDDVSPIIMKKARRLFAAAGLGELP